jgi:hypothetical protein
VPGFPPPFRASHLRFQALANVHGIPWGEASRFPLLSLPGQWAGKAEVRLGTPAWECDLFGPDLLCAGESAGSFAAGFLVGTVLPALLSTSYY